MAAQWLPEKSSGPDTDASVGMFPVAEHVGKQIVSLPMFYAMNEVDVERTCKAMREVFGM
ncbi:MAG: hypothetical protein Q7J38_10225 [Gallionella sp.]|nr:hypothetical protein [Gallionella sp.]